MTISDVSHAKQSLALLPPKAAALFAARNPLVKKAISGSPPKIELPCVYEGPVAEYCKTCGGGAAETKHVRQCAHPAPSDPDREFCTRGVVSDKVHSCTNCQDRKLPHDPESFVARFDASVIPDGPGAHRFNPSIMPFGDGALMAFRTGWAGSEICTVPLDRHWKPVGRPNKLDLSHPDASYGREDPRLFLHDGVPHLSFIGVVGRDGRVSHTNQLYARLSADGTRVSSVVSPSCHIRKPWEKNWGPVSWNGTLLFVYSISPHVVLHARDGEAVLSYKMNNPLPWGGGERRGGAPPVLVGNEYWSFFHDRIESGGQRIYRLGLYTFDANPPFAPRRHVPTPVMSANPLTRPPDQYCAAVFPGGVVLRDGWWYAAMGLHDRWSEIHRFRHEELEGKLVKG